MPSEAGGAANSPAASAVDPFDALLGGSAGVRAAAPPAPEMSAAPTPAASAAPQSPETSAAHGRAVIGVESQRPTLHDFFDGWQLYRDPVLCGALAGAGLGALGVFVVLRRAVFVTAALSQAAGLGVALAFYAQIQLDLDVSPVLGAFASSVIATLLVGARPPLRMSREALVGFAFVATSALAVVVGDRIAQEAHDIASILFGTAVLVRRADLWLVFGATALSFVALFALGRGLTFTGFDAEGARVQKLPVRALEIGFWLLFALEVSVSSRALGSLPVFAFAVLPAIGGLALASSVRMALALAVLAGVGAASIGYLAAFVFELPVGGSQALVAALWALAAALIAARRAKS